MREKKTQALVFKCKGFRPAILGWPYVRGNGIEQDLPAPRGRTSLAAVLGLGRQESLTPHARDVHSVRRNEATFGTFFDAQIAAFERRLLLLCNASKNVKVNPTLYEISKEKMNMKQFSLITVLTVLLGCQTAQPITDLKTPYKIKGFSFLPPQGPNWYPTERSDPGAVQIYFFKKDEAFEQDIKQTIAGEVFILFLAPQTKDDKAILQEFADSVVQMDQKVPDRHVIVSEKNQFVTQGNMLILKKSRLAEDRKVPRWPNEVFYMRKTEVFALNKAKRAIIMMNYSQRYPKTIQPRDLAQELEPYLQSLSLYDEAL